MNETTERSRERDWPRIGAVLFLVAAAKALGPGANKPALLAEQDDVEQISAKLRVPKSLRPDYVGLRQDIHDVRGRVASL